MDDISPHPCFVRTSDPDGWLCVETPSESVVFTAAGFGISPIRAAYSAWRVFHAMTEPTKTKITVRTGVLTEVGNGTGRRTARPPAGGLKVEAWDAGNRYYNFEWSGTTWQVRDDKVTIDWDDRPWWERGSVP